ELREGLRTGRQRVLLERDRLAHRHREGGVGRERTLRDGDGYRVGPARSHLAVEGEGLTDDLPVARQLPARVREWLVVQPEPHPREVERVSQGRRRLAAPEHADFGGLRHERELQPLRQRSGGCRRYPPPRVVLREAGEVGRLRGSLLIHQGNAAGAAEGQDHQRHRAGRQPPASRDHLPPDPGHPFLMPDPRSGQRRTLFKEFGQLHLAPSRVLAVAWPGPDWPGSSPCRPSTRGSRRSPPQRGPRSSAAPTPPAAAAAAGRAPARAPPARRPGGVDRSRPAPPAAARWAPRRSIDAATRRRAYSPGSCGRTAPGRPRSVATPPRPVPGRSAAGPPLVPNPDRTGTRRAITAPSG